MILREYTKTVVKWHEQRFPKAKREHVALKLCEEAGEVAKAINGEVGTGSATGGGSVPEEVADVIICALVLLGRWYPEVNFDEVINDKIYKLNTPGEHPASLLT